MSIENFNLKHIVLSPSYPQNSQEFRDVWSDEFISWFRNNAEFYSIFLEHADSNCHLDINVWVPKSKDFTNWARSLKKLIKKFLDANPASEFQNFYKVSKIPPTEEDNLYLIGYNQKEHQGLHNLPLDLVSRGVEYYEEHKKTKKLRKFMNTNPLNPKNVVTYLLEQSQTLKIKEYKELIFAMVQEGFSFVPINDKSMLKAKLEFLIRTGSKLKNSDHFDFLKFNGAHSDIEKEEWWKNLVEKSEKFDDIQNIILSQGSSLEDKMEKIFDIIAQN